MTMETKNHLAVNLRMLRTEYGYTQEQLSAYLEITQSAYNKYEAGVNDVPMDKLEKLATLYNVEEYDLLTSDVGKLKLNMAFAFRNNGNGVELGKIETFRKIVHNYLEMCHEIDG